MGDLDVLKTKGTVRVLVSADLGFYYIEDGKPKVIVCASDTKDDQNVLHSFNVQIPIKNCLAYYFTY